MCWVLLYEGVMCTYYQVGYQTQMLRALKEVRADNSVVGFYQSMTMGAFFSQNLKLSIKKTLAWRGRSGT